MLSWSCVIRKLASYVRAIQRPFGDVIFVRFALASRVKVTTFPKRSCRLVSAACCGREARNPSRNLRTVPSFRVSVQPFPFQAIEDLYHAVGVATCSYTASVYEVPGD